MRILIALHFVFLLAVLIAALVLLEGDNVIWLIAGIVGFIVISGGVTAYFYYKRG